MASLAAEWSKDPDKQVGCVLVSPMSGFRTWAIGVNGLPSGFPDDLVMDKETKRKYCLHAESNAISNAATDLRGWWSYVTEAPCLDCAIELHRAGIVRVVSPPLNPVSTWLASQKEAEQFLAGQNVEQARWD